MRADGDRGCLQLAQGSSHLHQRPPDLALARTDRFGQVLQRKEPLHVVIAASIRVRAVEVHEVRPTNPHPGCLEGVELDRHVPFVLRLRLGRGLHFHEIEGVS